VKLIKTLGGATLAVLMTMGSVGTSSAMAEKTMLCGVDGLTCASPITHVHEATLAGHPAELLSSLGTIKCDALFLGDTVAGTSAPLKITGSFTYSNCKRGTESCTAKEEGGPSIIQVLKEGAETTKVTGEGEVKLVCGIFISCKYNGEGLKGIDKGPLLSSETNGSVALSEQETHKVSGICPSTAKLDITTTPLSATYITSSEKGMALCKVDEVKCATANQITHVHEATLAGHPAELLSSIGTISCDALFLGDTVAGTGAPLKITGSFTYSNCKLGTASCTAKEEGGPSVIEVLKEGAETTKVTGEGEVKVECEPEPVISCTYNGENLLGTGKGPLLSSETNGGVSLSEQETHQVSGTCPSTAKLDITTTPLSATYITG
jgi:hypothetical protein